MATSSGSVVRSAIPARSVPRQSFWLRLKLFLSKNGTYMLMALPGVALIFIFAYAPMPGIVIAFKDLKFNLGVWGSPWVGLNNFGYLVATPLTGRVLFNTLFMNALFIVTGTAGAIGVALLMNEVHGHFRSRVYQSAMFFPNFISVVVVSYFVFAFLSTDAGLVNNILKSSAMEPVQWYSSPEYWPVILVTVNLWKGVGVGSIIYLATIVSINPEFYEAARIDGANKLDQIRFITLPLLVPVITILTLLAIGRIFYADFGLFFIVTRDTPALYPTTDVIDTFVFRALRQLGDIGMAAAAGLAQSVIGFILVIISNMVVRKVDPEKSLF
ncbi:MAG: ABC transporter permease subunit [Chloroflexi bacterium]|nr:ABC transporter permease subunit [Chloroflexota bacterium]MCL5274128.1 ABC transporter permease subunit [Chloroflexota bacterium]